MSKQRTAKESFFTLRKGTKIIGRKNGQHYTIERKLTDQPLVTTYLCASKKGVVYVSIGQPTKKLLHMLMNMQSFWQAQEKQLGPILLDVDYWQSQSDEVYIFYVMPLMEGEMLQSYLKREGDSLLPLFIYQLLGYLHRIHRMGFVVGSMKLEHLFIIRLKSAQLYPFNGLVKQGELMPWLPQIEEPSYWLLSSRCAHPKNDLFSLVILILQLFDQKQYKSNSHSKQQLIEKINQLPLSVHYKQCFLKAVLGKYNTAYEMKKQFLQAIAKVERKNFLTKKIYDPTLSEITAIFSISLSCIMIISLLF